MSGNSTKRKPPGSEFIDNTSGYTFVKDEAGHWHPKHLLIWKAANGPIPKGFFIKFIDGNKNNIDLGNLTLVSRAGHLIKKKQSQYQIGSETEWKNKYIWVKIGHPNIWRMKHHLIWETAHGQIPDGHRIMFADGDKSNFRLDNLILLSHSDLSKKINQNYYNHVNPVGSERIHLGYTQIKVRLHPSVWRLKHHMIWEAVHGKIPQGHAVWFVDGDRSNFRLDNLILVNQQEHGFLLSKGLVDVRGDWLNSAYLAAKVNGLLKDKLQKQGKVKL